MLISQKTLEVGKIGGAGVVSLPEDKDWYVLTAIASKFQPNGRVSRKSVFQPALFSLGL